MRPLELRRRVRDIATFAEYLAEDGRGHPNRALDAMGALAEWCEGDPELLAHAPLHHSRRTANVGVLENNHAIQLLVLVDSAS
jgi:hypothetical protein